MIPAYGNSLGRCCSEAEVRAAFLPADSLPATLQPAPPGLFDNLFHLKGARVPRWFVLAPAARGALTPLLGRFGLDLRALTFSLGGAFGNRGLTLGRTILLTPEFARDPYPRQLSLLAHEITHAVQYKILGWTRLLIRYAEEWARSDGDPYGVPAALRQIPISEVDPVDGRFYLDQLGDRFALAAWEGR
jgi:hypothetical protein